MIDFGNAANYLAELGYAVFPCAPGGKRPITPNGLLDATTDAEQIAAWWEKTPDANIAVRTDGLLVIDVDVDGAGNANAWLADQPDKLLDLAAAPMSLTPRGGRHYWYRQPGYGGLRNTASKIAASVDTRADGGYVIVPPSVRTDGAAYRWAGELLDIGPDKLREPPFWLLKLVCEGSGAAAPKERAAKLPSNRIPDGQRNAALTSLAGTMRRVGMSVDEILAALRKANQDRCVPSLPDSEVETIARSVASYSPNPTAVAVAEHWAEQEAAEDESQYFTEDPGPAPVELLRVPGFISEVMDHTLATAPYPNQALAFCGALTLQAFLAGRKVRDPEDNRTNLYVLGLAHSASGKDHPRKRNAAILRAVGLIDGLGNDMASAEGLQDALYHTPSMLFQTDEIDALLQAMAKANDARYIGLQAALLSYYSAANSTIAIRKKAGQEAAGEIIQPSLVLFGTAIPNHYYSALTEKMLTNGFLARMLIVESGRRGRNQEITIAEIPARVLETAKWWAELKAGAGNLWKINPEPAVVEYEPDAKKLRADVSRELDDCYRAAEDEGDAVATTVWGRGPEHFRKLALIYAISECHTAPMITADAVTWAREFVYRQSQRMLYQAKQHVSENPFHDLCLRAKKHLAKGQDRQLRHSRLLKLMKVDTAQLSKVMQTLSTQGDVAIFEETSGGRPATAYKLLRV